MTGYYRDRFRAQEPPVELPCPYPDGDLDPAPVPGCDECDGWALKRAEARGEGHVLGAVIASMNIRRHVKWGSHG